MPAPVEIDEACRLAVSLAGVDEARVLDGTDLSQTSGESMMRGAP